MGLFMTEKLYYWAENLEDYSSDNDTDTNNQEVIEIKRLNFFIGKNNAGKSRFLRTIFINNYPSGFYNFSELVKNLKIFKLCLDKSETELGYSSSHSNIKHNYKDLIKDLQENKVGQLIFLNSSIKGTLERDSNIRSFFKDYNLFEITDEQVAKISDVFVNRFYIPILRGMRPVTNADNKQPYLERAQKDYFPEKDKFHAQNIVTGECLYNVLKEKLLGEPEDRELIKSYEEKLSQYFFDNETVSLIPKHNQDVVNIKIGKDAQRAIFELGDGLQQAIILTYEAFINKDKTHAFFIEEPELHMHAGMVRQLMNFYLNETPHYYFFTTHSNHLLDMADESDQVMIQKFVKQPKVNNPSEFDFKIYRCDRDRDLLASLGVRPSSVYLANCTIWVEGITDRLYITKYMEKYLDELQKYNEELYKKYRRFMPNYHYTFVEYAGSNLSHWSFDNDYPKTREERIEFLKKDRGQSATAVASEMLLIADGDIQKNSEKIKFLRKELNKENLIILECKETENTLPKDSILRVAKAKFPRLKNVKQSYDISRIDNITDDNYFDNSQYGIGRLIDEKIKNPTSSTTKTAFADGTGVGTIKDKLKFCREIIKDFDKNPEWQLTPKAKVLCERVFKHIEKCNS